MQKKVLIGYSIVSPLHLINFLTYLSSNKNIFDEVYVFVGIYWSSSIIPERYVKYCKDNNINVVFDDSEKNEILKEIYKSSNEIYFVCVKSPSIKIMFRQLFTKKIKNIIVIDEGLSSYAGYLHSIKAIIREGNIYILFRFFLVCIIIFILEKLNGNRVEKYSAFLEDDININQNYKNNFSKVLLSVSSTSNFEIIGNNFILFCTQPWVDLQVMGVFDYEYLLDNLRAKVEKMGYKLLIKKHPADLAFNYNNFDVLNFDGIVEELVLVQNFSGLISMCSTSSILVSSCFDIKSYLLSFDDLNSMDKNLQRIFEHYCIDFNRL